MKVGHSNVCKPMTKRDALIWDPPIRRQIPNPKEIVRMLKYSWWKNRFAQDLHYENTKIDESYYELPFTEFTNFSIFVMSCASFYLIPPGVFQHRTIILGFGI